ncbi:filamentous hemagglutinin [Pandoraea horticolens]|uniref:Filamentous hemagglutinin n=1 Tax=Pandoraea horticolens TaxID=2508298 RepID=A0A5E4ZEH1_9BURK|nr:filamentous hemagglutinin [Pandoraea horticolens]
MAGKAAQVVVANSAGIMVDGGGFINTTRAVLTTGTPILGADGSLAGYQVNGGRLSIQGEGLNAANVDQVDLIARAVQVNAALHAKNLNVVTGTNRVEHESLALEKLASDGATPDVAIDVGQLGGMYAQRIFLVGTENGVGVSNKGVIAAQAGDLTLTTEGKLVSTGKTETSGNLAVAARGGIENRGSVYAGGGADLRTDAALENHGVLGAAGDLAARAASVASDGTLGAGIDANGQATLAGNLSVTADGKVSATGSNVARGDLAMTGGAVDLSGSRTDASGSLSLTSTAADVDLQKAIVTASNALKVQSAQHVLNAGGALGADTLTLAAMGNIDNRDAQTVATTRLDVSGTGIDNQRGLLQSGTALTVKGTTLDNTAGRVVSLAGDDTSVDIKGELRNAGGTTANGKTGGVIGANGDLRVHADSLVNASQIVAGKALNVVANQVDNTGGEVIGGGDVTLGVDGTLDNTGGRLFGGTSLSTTKASTRVVNANGTIESAGNVAMQVSSLENAGGAIRSNQDIGVGGAMSGAGQMTAGRDLTVAAVGDYLNSATNRLRADGVLKLTSTGRLTNEGAFNAPGTLDVQAGEIVNTASGGFNAATTHLSAGGLFSNAGSIGGDTVRLQAGHFVNTNAVLGNDVQVNANDIENQGAAAVMGGAKRLALYAPNSVSNYDGALLYSTGDIEIARDGTRDGTGLLANQTATLNNRSANIIADGNLDIAAHVVNNTRTSIVTRSGTPESTTQSFSLYTAGLPVGEETLGHTSLTFPEWNWSAGFAPVSSALLERLARPITVEVPKSQVANLDAASKTFSLTKPLEESYQDATTAGRGPCDDHGQCASTTKTREVGKNPTQYYNNIVDNGSTYRITFWPDWDPNTMIRPDQAISRGDLGIDQHDYNEISRRVTTTRTRDELVSATPEAKLQAQGSIRINADGGAVNNQSSTMTAGRDLIRRAQGGTINDTGIVLQEKVAQSQTSTFYWHQKSGGDSEQLDVAYPVTPLPPVTVASLPAIALGGQSVQSFGHDITVASVDRTGNTVNGAGVTQTLGSSAQAIPGLTLPRNGLFQIQPAPGQTYLVATDPRFTSYGKFISSDHMLGELGLDPQKTQKRLGDGFYETQLVRDQITGLTGKTLLAGYTDYLDEYTALLNNGVAYGKQFGLALGVGLSDVQMKQLTSDMVWLVSQNVTLPDGSVQSVLVPKVYLAQANRVDLTNTGALVGGGSVKLAATGDVKNSGRIVSDTATTILGDTIVNLGAVGSGGTTALSASGDIRNTGGHIGGKDVVAQAGRDLINESSTLTQKAGTDNGGGFTSSASATGIGAVGVISGTNSVAAVAGRDVTLNAGAIASDGAVVVAAGRDIKANTVTVGQSQTVGTTDGQNGGSDVVAQHVGSAISAGGNLTTVSGRDTTLTGATMAAGGNATVLAGNDVTVTAAKDSHTHDERSFGGSLQYTKSSLDEAVRGSSVSAGGDVLVGAGQTGAVNGVLGAYQVSQVSPVGASSGTGNLSLLGSSVSSQGAGTVALAATGDVTTGTVTETHDSKKWQHDSSSGFLSTTEETSASNAHQTIGVGSTVSGNAVGVAAGRDLAVSGSTVVGTQDVALQAGRDLHIASAQNESESSSFYEKKHSGLGASGGVGISYGKNEQRDWTNDSGVTQTGSLVGSLNGNVSMVAGKDLTVRGSDIVAAGDVTGIGQNVTVESAQERSHHDETHEFKSSGFTLAVKSPVIDAIQNVTNQAKSAADSGGDARVSALRGYAAASGAYGAYNEANKALDALKSTDPNVKPEVKVELSWGSSSSKSTSSFDGTTNVGSHIKAGGTAAFVATGDAASGKGNVNIVGSNVDAKDVLLQATNQVNLRNSTDTESSRSENESKSGSFGVSFGTGGWGVSASLSRAHGDANSDSQFQNNTHINASNTAVIVSGGDTNIVGANVNADKVIARVGGDLKVASVQDTSESAAHQESMGGGLSLSMSGASGSFSASRGNASGSYAGVAEQSGIQAGSGGFDVNVAGNTDLKGAYIASTADPSKNQLTTGTLTFSDIQNHSDYKANSFGVGGGFSVGNGGANERTTGPSSGKNTGSPSLMLPQSESGSERGTTRSGVSDGTITLTNGASQTQDLASLNRETSDLNQTVSRTPDLQKTLDGQSRLMGAATAAGEAVARDIGTYANKKRDEAQKLADSTKDPALKAKYEQEAKDWSEGGDSRALMHTAGGAIVAGLGGGNALGGALGAGATSKLGGVLNQLSEDIRDSHPTGNADVDQALGQIVATGVGTAVGAAAGGSSGAFTGFNTDRYNRQLSQDQYDKARQYKKIVAQKLHISEEEAEGRIVAEMLRNSDKKTSDASGGIMDWDVRRIVGCQHLNCNGKTDDPQYENHEYNSQFIAKNQQIYDAGTGRLGVGKTYEQMVRDNYDKDPIGNNIARAGVTLLAGSVTGGMTTGLLAKIVSAWSTGTAFTYVGDAVSYEAGLSKDQPSYANAMTTGAVAAGLSPLVLPLNTLGSSATAKATVSIYNGLLSGTGAFGATAMTNPSSSPDISGGIGAAASILSAGGRMILPGPIAQALDIWLQILPGPAQAAIENGSKKER